MDSQSAWQFGRPAIDFVLVHTSHPGNIGAAARAISVMGFNRLVLVRPFTERAHQHADAIAMASGATEVLDQCRTVDTLAQAIADSRFAVGVSAEGREYAAAPQTADAICKTIAAMPELCEAAPSEPAPIALVFGTERDGLRLSEAQQCQAMCRIDSNPAYGSLNLAQAVQVIAYVMRQALLSIEPEPPPPAPRLHHRDMPAPNGQVDRMLTHLESVLVSIGFLDPTQPKRLMQRLRYLYNRAGLSVTEVDILRGIFTQVEKEHHRRPDSSRPTERDD
jgi:tRNA/rRNA methyltransferase